jgi:hypothetical protein
LSCFGYRVICVVSVIRVIWVVSVVRIIKIIGVILILLGFITVIRISLAPVSHILESLYLM